MICKTHSTVYDHLPPLRGRFDDVCPVDQDLSADGHVADEEHELEHELKHVAELGYN